MENMKLFILVVMMNTFSFIMSSTSYGVLLLDTGEDPEIIDKRSIAAAAPYEQVCRLEIDRGNRRGSGTLIHREGQILYILTAAHCVRNINKKDYEGDINAIFTLKDDREICCPALHSYIPEFGPMEFVAEKLNSDIAIIVCFLPHDREFNVMPMRIVEREEGEKEKETGFFLKKYEGKFLGYGYHGINNSHEKVLKIEVDENRRLGETNLIEYREGSHWNITCILPVGFHKDSFVQSKKPFLTRLKKGDEQLRLDYKYYWGEMYNLHGKQDIIKQSLHPRQARIMDGDSGGPLLISQKGFECIQGVSIQQTYVEGMGLHFDQFTPVLYYKEWIRDILEGRRPADTDESIIIPNLKLGYFQDGFLEFKTKRGAHVLLHNDIGIHFFNENSREENINFSDKEQTLRINDFTFDFNSYASQKEAFEAIHASQLFEEFKHGKGELPVEVLAKSFFKDFEAFLENRDVYPYPIYLVDQALEKFQHRYKELVERGLPEGYVTENHTHPYGRVSAYLKSLN